MSLITHMKNLFILCIFMLNFTYANDGIRICTKDDLIGVWSVTHIKLIDEKSKENLYYFLMPNQILMYKKNGELKSLYSTDTSKKDIQSYLKLFEFTQGDTYKINNGTISIFRDNKQIGQCICHYFTKHNEKASISKGSISLIRFSNGQPAIGNVYTKITPEPAKGLGKMTID